MFLRNVDLQRTKRHYMREDGTLRINNFQVSNTGKSNCKGLFKRENTEA
jgi:hypothetical protein